MRHTQLVLLFAFFAVFGNAQNYYTSPTKPNCGTHSLFQVPDGSYSCREIIIFPHFAVGDPDLPIGKGWKTQVTYALPPQPKGSPLKGIEAQTQPGYYASGGGGSGFSLYEDALGVSDFFTSVTSSDQTAGSAITQNFSSLGQCPQGCASLPSVALPGLGQGPMYTALLGTDASTLDMVLASLTYSYANSGVNWQVSVLPVKSKDSNPHWFAPYYNLNGETTAFSVVNMAPADQSVKIVVRDGAGNILTGSKSTPMLKAAYADNWSLLPYNLNPNSGVEMLPGGFYAATAGNFFGQDAAKGQGTMELSSDQGGPIVVIVLRWKQDGKTMGSVPVAPF